ncbi:MAG: FAD-dependent oxidoreductase, partial [Candidatus Brocadiales bacterium]|nr:FAD-dependent oxidoreductase [Candidatus Brocadiales bacterium]
MTEASEGRITIGFKKPELLVSLQERPIIKYKGPLKRLLEEKKFQVTATIDQNWYPGNIPCRVACPIGTNARGYSRAIAEGKYQLAYLLARQNNPFVSVLGKVCSAPCEPACQRGKVDEPVSIRALKYFAVEKNTLSTKEVYRWLNKKKSKILLAKRDKPPRVAVVGAGPAGLYAAHDLALMGYKVKVFEASGQPGGMLNIVPSYRLDREDIKRDIEGILFLGIELETNKSCGRDFGINELLKEYDAVLLAPGLQKSKTLNIPGIQLKGVLQGVEFLREVAARGKVDLGKRIVVIGGGDMALDVARTALRLMGEGGKVSIVSFEAAKGSRPDMPQEELSAHPCNIAEAEEEGVAFHTSLGPRQIIGKNGWIKAVELEAVRTVYNGHGRFNPTFENGERATLEADTLILALGQDWDSSSLKGSGLVPQEGEGLEIDPETLMTSHPGVFLCGDAVGSRSIVEAVASAQKAAQSIHLYLGGSGYLGLNGPSQIVPVKHHERMDRFLVRTSI